MKIKSICTKGISILLSTMMVASFIPVAVYADNDPDNNYFEEDLDNKYGDPETGKTDKAVYVRAREGDVGVEGGDIECTSEEYGPITGGLGVSAYGEYNPETFEPVEGGAKYTATVTTGNITNTYELGAGAFIMSEYGGTSDVTINGDVSGVLSGVHAVADMGGKTNVFISGDVVGTTGLYADTKWESPNTDECGTVNVHVDGTITGKETGVIFREEGKENITITAWAITPNADGIVAGYDENPYDDEYVYIQDKNFEENNIFYIIKLGQPNEGDAFTAVDQNGTIVNNGDVRKENTRIRLQAISGYDITGAFNGVGEKVEIQKDAEGYYIDVPKGGGVYLTVTVNKKTATKILNPQTTNGESSSSNNTENGASLCASIAEMIMNAAPGATVTVLIPSGTSLCKAAVDALEVRKDVTLIVNYGFNNGTYSATIPANTDLTQYKNAVGGIDFETLTTNFNGRQIY